MTKETRSNLIFLAIVIVVLLPGAILLVRKKMSPDARRADLPDPVPRTVTFMDPQPLPPGMRRVAPPKTTQWFATLVREKVGNQAVTELIDSDGLPLMSDDKTFQLAAVREESGATRIWLASWDPTDADFFRGARWTLATNERVTEGVGKAFEQIEIPDRVRDELGENGLLKPPKSLAWREIEFPAASSSTWRITAEANKRSDQLVFVPSFTNPAGIKK
jgi:hypothetical protein